jgi:hypothetical protein
MYDLATNQRTNMVNFMWLVLAGLLGSLIGVPWTLAVLSDTAAMDQHTVWLSAIVEALFFLAPASAIGVWMGKQVDLGPRLLNELISRMPSGWQNLQKALPPTVLTGMIVGVVGYFSQNEIPRSALLPGLENPRTFEVLLRALSAALTEEILFRLGLITFFVWAIRAIIKQPAIYLPSLWVGNLLAALLFAGAHLPQLTFQTYGLSLSIPLILFSSSAGMIMGWLYMRYGLISAIFAHFLVDFVVYVFPRLATEFA